MFDRARFALTDSSRYGIVLILLISAVMTAIIWPPGTLSSLLTATLQGASVIVALSRPTTGGALRVVQVCVVLASVAVAALARGSILRGLSDLLNAAVIVLLPVIILARFRRNLYVNVQSVLGAVCIYLVIGILFASVDSGITSLTGQPFFGGAPKVTSSQYTYFSFITLTTVGYGDLSPGSGVARALAVVEALTGQLYLVTVIALIVGRVGRPRDQGIGTSAG